MGLTNVSSKKEFMKDTPKNIMRMTTEFTTALGCTVN